MTRRDRIAVGVLVGLGLYLWFAHPALMALILLVLLIPAMLTLAVMAMARGDRRRWSETKGQRVLRIVNESEPRFHWWR